MVFVHGEMKPIENMNENACKQQFSMGCCHGEHMKSLRVANSVRIEKSENKWLDRNSHAAVHFCLMLNK